MISSNCNGDILQVGLAVRGQAICSHCEIAKEVFKDGIALKLADTTYKIAGFTMSYSFDKAFLIQKKVYGNSLSSRKASFLKRLKEGDYISIDCVKIIKGGTTSLSTTIAILIH